MKGIDPALFTEAATEEVSRNKRPPIPWLSGPCFQKNVREMHWALLLKFLSKTTLIKWGCCNDETDCGAHGTRAGPGCVLSVGITAAKSQVPLVQRGLSKCGCHF